VSIEGQVIDGKYRVVKLLGAGGMGAVYLAEHMVIGRKVAVKVLLGSVAGNETAVARFEREAQAAGRIGNDHILEVFDFGSLPDGSRYMVCEFLDGETLAARLTRQGRIPPEALLPIARQLLSGLAAAHQAGVVHRDLKPENVFILRHKAGLADFVKIIDFGISKFQPLSTGEGMQMTATGIVVGTPCYLSPEQARGSRDADNRSDLYAVGVILYECVTGQLPFNAENVNDLLFKIVLESPIPLRDAAPDVDPGFAQLVEIAMARDPDKRFQSAASFMAALDAWATERGIATASVGSAGGRPVSSSGILPTSDVKLPSGATRSLAPTPGTWADSQVSVSAFQPRRRRLLVPIVGAIVGVLGVGLAFAFLRDNGADHPSPTVASSAPSPSVGASGTASPPAIATVAPVETSEPSPDFKVPPVSSEAVHALLDPPTDPNIARQRPKPGFVQRRPQTASTAKKQAEEAPPPPPPPPPPPAGTSKRRHDYGY